MTSTSRRLLRSAVAFYVARSPISRGKGRLIHTFRPWLRTGGETALTRTAFGCLMDLDLSEYVQERIYFFGEYEAPLVRYFETALKPGMVFADIGAQVGQFTLLAAKLVGPSGHVHAFEPTSESFSRLRRNIELNQFTNVTCHPFALDDHEGTQELFSPKQAAKDRNSGMSSLRRKAEWKDASSVSIPARKFDDALPSIQRLDAMKIDVEGAELSVLQGARNALIKFKPLIAVEAEETSARAFHYSTRDLKAFLEDLNYGLFRIPRAGESSALTPTTSGEIEHNGMLIAAPHGHGSSR